MSVYFSTCASSYIHRGNCLENKIFVQLLLCKITYIVIGEHLLVKRKKPTGKKAQNKLSFTLKLHCSQKVVRDICYILSTILLILFILYSCRIGNGEKHREKKWSILCRRAKSNFEICHCWLGSFPFNTISSTWVES